METMKYCKDCKYYSPRRAVHDRCIHDLSVVRIDIVSGTTRYDSCADMRIVKCGPEAKLFAAKPKPWWKLW